MSVCLPITCSGIDINIRNTCSLIAMKLGMNIFIMCHQHCEHGSLEIVRCQELLSPSLLYSTEYRNCNCLELG